ncbi:hypothetical protein [Gloeobacter violaceus]|uniref:hypothetical protein n=1 Tax=Gloeobacter violaceus TaxID=33072 RepID=UPI0013E8E654|nr:hypothetical protein [Gloeobacter violaceus]
MHLTISGDGRWLEEFRARAEARTPYTRDLHFPNFLPRLKALGAHVLSDEGSRLKVGVGIVTTGITPKGNKWLNFKPDPDWPEPVELPKDANTKLIERSERHLVYTAWQKSFWAPRVIHFLARAHPELEFWYKFRFEAVYGWGRAKGRDVFHNQFSGEGQEQHWLDFELWEYNPQCSL